MGCILLILILFLYCHAKPLFDVVCSVTVEDGIISSPMISRYSCEVVKSKSCFGLVAQSIGSFSGNLVLSVDGRGSGKSVGIGLTEFVKTEELRVGCVSSGVKGVVIKLFGESGSVLDREDLNLSVEG